MIHFKMRQCLVARLLVDICLKMMVSYLIICLIASSAACKNVEVDDSVGPDGFPELDLPSDFVDLRSSAWLIDLSVDPGEEAMFCGATWIGGDYVITLASCIKGKPLSNIRVVLRSRERDNIWHDCTNPVGIKKKFPTKNRLVLMELDYPQGMGCSSCSECRNPTPFDCSFNSWHGEQWTWATIYGYGNITSPGDFTVDLHHKYVKVWRKKCPCKGQFKKLKKYHMCGRGYDDDFDAPCYGNPGGPVLVPGLDQAITVEDSMYIIGIQDRIPHDCQQDKWAAYISIASVCKYVQSVTGVDWSGVFDFS